MKKLYKSDELESLLIDYIDGNLNTEQKEEAEHELAHNEAARKLHGQLSEVMGVLKKSSELETSVSMRPRFEKALAEEIKQTHSPAGKQVAFRPVFYRAAAAIAALIVAVSVGYWVVKSQQQQNELAAVIKEMAAQRQMMMAMLENQHSASTRVQGATVAYHMEKPDDGIVFALVKVMNEDANTNVRLAALEALGKFNQDAGVRRALISSLSTQKDPVVQIALIQLLVEMKEKGVVKELQEIVDDVQTMKAVRDEAYTGMLKLS